MDFRVIKYNIIQFYHRNFGSYPTGVAMFHFGRCGSTVLGEFIGQHSMVKWDSELFQMLKRSKNKPYDIKYEDDYLKILRNRYNRTSEAIYGFETKAIESAHFSNDFLNITTKAYINYLVKIGFSNFIILKRSNYLKQLISIARGIGTGKWHFETNEFVPGNSFSFDPREVLYGNKLDELINHFESFDKQYKLIEEILVKNNIKYLYLNYETDIDKDPIVAYKKVCRFLGIDEEPVDITLRKSRILPLEEEISNFDALVKYFSSTSYRWMLEN